MISRLVPVTVLAVLSTALLTSCTDDPAPTLPSTTTTTTTAPPTPRDSPPVRNPLDVRKFVADPCTSLTPEQLTELSLGDRRESTGDDADQSEDGCTYLDLDPATRLIVYVNYYPDVTDGLEYRYDQHQAGQWVVWNPTEVDGYPAVAFRSKDDPTGCLVDVGLSDTDFFNIKYFYYAWVGYDGRDTCAAATNVAAAVLATVKAAN